MASPQLEDGYTRIANEILEVIMRTNLSSYQTRILATIWRETYGFQKKDGWLSNSQLVEKTGLRKQHVSRTLKELLTRNIVTKSGYKIAFNKDYTQWRELPKRVTVTNSGYRVTSTGVKSNQFRGTQKKKYNKEIYVRSFEEFWKTYPARNGKKLEPTETFKRYCKLPEADLALCNQAVINYANSENVKKGIGIKDPKRFLLDGKDTGYWREWIEPESAQGNGGGSYIDQVKERMGI